MKIKKEVFLSAAVILGGTGLIWGNGILASNALETGKQRESAIVMKEEDKMGAMELSNVGMYSNSDGAIYMALTNSSDDVQKKEEEKVVDGTDMSGKIQNPVAGNLTEEEAKEIGIKAISERFGLTQKDIKKFHVKVNIRYNSPLPSNIANMKPSFTVSKEAPSTDEDMVPSSETDVLIWSVTLTPINQEDYPTIESYRAVFEDESTELMSVHDIPLIKEGTPLENEISSDKAKEIAIDAITKKYALTQKTLDRFTVTFKYYEVTSEVPGKHVWMVDLYPTNTDEFAEIGCYWTYIDAKTGEVLQLNSAANGKG